MSRRADVIVVGAGSSGCALAARLSENARLSVLLLEAGGAGWRDPRISVPAAFATLHGSGRDWNYRTEPQPALGGRRLRWPRGRVLGGSSATNYMVYLRGHRAGYDAWGCPGWGSEDTLAAFRRLENHALGPSRLHGAGGPVSVTAPRWPNPLPEAFLEACEQAGIERVGDLDGESQEGAARYFVTCDRGSRESAATAYLRDCGDRPNLEIRTDARVLRLLWRGDTIAGVELDAGGGRVVALHAGRVVLCAGAIESPALLLRSGVGPASELRVLGVSVVADRPEVGGNLSDHLLVPLVVGARGARTFPAAVLRHGAVTAYLRRRDGPLSSTIADAGALVRTSSHLERPDLQLTFTAAFGLRHGRALPPRHAFTITAVLLQPRSRGRLWLRATDPRVAPAIDPGYLTHQDDERVLLHGLRLARRIAGQPALACWRRQEIAPGAQANDDQHLLRHIRAHAETSYHPVGSCRMGTDPCAVVDARLRVRGVSGLWVADASIIPEIPGANTNAACLMIGERAADLMRDDLQ